MFRPERVKKVFCPAQCGFQNFEKVLKTCLIEREREP